MNVGDRVNVFKAQAVGGFTKTSLFVSGVVVRRYKHINRIVIKSGGVRHLVSLDDRSISVYRADARVPREVRA